ncbi:hypothetical protein [Stenomitos frigidus]|uniref:Uncharacterized protein n=1 Tax=Stenomitos frigidus ULC18 TaxID=2107698 RepID=A0A2T1ELS7_9CYAN|nr:hypothetical protein [Stenomitos frigidus]PSB33702.1 hypothetical protein C7B82_04250 [Stenomitos frigidus ULC18]
MTAKPSTKRKPQWIFDPVPPSGQFTGGIPSAYVFKPELDTFVREVLQNSLDARKAASQTPTEVKFTFRQLQGDDRTRFLNTIDWEYLQTHLQAVAEGHTAMSTLLANTISDLNSTPLTILRIDDSSTEGLTGDEDTPGTNFSSLCRNILDTTKDAPSKGGSYGLGKALLWQFSTLSTVLFSSRLEGEAPQQFRFFARTELPSHETEQARWNGSGWYGLPETVRNGKRAVSIWDEVAEKITRSIYLYRPVQLGTGTSIMVVGFHEPAQEEARPLAAIAQEILHSAAQWFWYCMISATPSLRVVAEVYEGHELSFRGEAIPGKELEPFIQTVLADTTVAKAFHRGEVAEKELTFKIPAKKSGEAPEVEAALNFRLSRGEDDSEDALWGNRIALIRGSGMVVEYRSPGKKLSGIPFCGVLRAGNARGFAEADDALEMFLKDAEPPSHDQWKATERLQEEYRKGSKSRLDKLWKDLDEAVVELCGQEMRPDAEAPEALARLFRKDAIQSGKTLRQDDQKLQVSCLEAFFTEGVWRFSGRVTQPGTLKKPWSFSLLVRLDSETGEGEKLLIDHLRTTGAASVQIKAELAECVVQPSSQEIVFEGETKPVHGNSRMPDLQRTRVRLEVQPGRGGR